MTLVCPLLKTVEVIKELKKKSCKVKLMWNQDDDKINYQNHKNITHQFYFNRIEFRFYSYPEGGHELQPKFIFELK